MGDAYFLRPISASSLRSMGSEALRSRTRSALLVIVGVTAGFAGGVEGGVAPESWFGAGVVEAGWADGGPTWRFRQRFRAFRTDSGFSEWPSMVRASAISLYGTPCLCSASRVGSNERSLGFRLVIPKLFSR